MNLPRRVDVREVLFDGRALAHVWFAGLAAGLSRARDHGAARFYARVARRMYHRALARIERETGAKP